MNRIAALVALAGIASVATLAHGQTYNFNGLPLFVPDVGTAPVTATTDVTTGSGVIVSVTCSVEWNPRHTWSSDIDLLLTYTPTNGAPVTVFLQNNIGGSNDLFGTYIFSDSATANFGSVLAGTVIAPGTYRAMSSATVPVSLATAFAGLPMSGTWTLSAQDFAGGDTGTIANASVTVVGGSAPVPPSAAAPTATLNRGAPGASAPYSTVITCSAFPGFNPVSSITGVVANLSSVGGGASVAMFDDGSNGDAVGGDGVYSLTVTPPAGLAAGSYSIGYTVRDALNRTGTASANLNVSDIAIANFGTLVFDGSEQSQSTDALAGQPAWFRFTTTAGASNPDSYVDINVAASTLAGDTVIAMFDASGNFIISDDNDGPGLLSQLSFGRTFPTRPALGTSRLPAGQDGDLAPGEFYLAVLSYQFPNTFTAPFAFSNTATPANNVTVNISASNLSPDPIAPTIAGSFLPASRINGLPTGGSGTAVLRATVVPGLFPASSGLTVTADLTGFGLAGAVSLVDDGTNGDETAGDNIFSATVNVASLAEGTYSASVSVSDAQGRSNTGTANFAVASVTNLGTVGAAGSSTLSGTASNGGSTAWFSFVNNMDATDPNGWLDTFVTASPFADTMMAVYDASGNVVASDDDSGAGLFSQLSFGRTSPARVRANSTNGIGQNGALPTGSYYIAVAQYFTTFAAPFTVGRAASIAGDITVSVEASADASLLVAGGTVRRGGPANPTAPFYATVTGQIAPATPGYVLTADFSSVGGGTSVAMVDDGTNGDVTAGDGIYTARYDVTSQTVGSYPVTVNTTGVGTLSGTVNINIIDVTVTDLGTLAFTGAGITHDNVIVGREVNWLRFELAQNVDAGGVLYLDIDTNGSSMDTHLGLFSSDGTYLNVFDDDDGDGLDSALSFGSTDTTGRDTNPLGIANNGRDGGLASGVYYLALNFFGTQVYGTPFVATNANGGVGGTYTVHLYPGAVGVVPPTCLSDINGDGTPADGGDFILFINSFGIGDATVDPLADVAGGGDPNRPEGGPDGNIDGTDFIAFINAFAAGC